MLCACESASFFLISFVNDINEIGTDDNCVKMFIMFIKCFLVVWLMGCSVAVFYSL